MLRQGIRRVACGERSADPIFVGGTGSTV